MAEGPIVVKIGGSTMGSRDTTLRDLVALQREGVRVVVAHGGGNLISQWMEREGAVPRFVRGIRVTDAQSLDVVTAVLAGVVNKGLVASLISLGGKAWGLSGVDGGLLEARVADEEMGYVGEVTRVNPEPLFQALDSGYIPLVAPLGLHAPDSSKFSGSLLNINADTVAGELAYSMPARRLIFLTDVEGVMDNSGKTIQRLNSPNARILLESGVVKGGMIPKLGACLRALERVTVADIIDGRKPGSLIDCVHGTPKGTQITGSGPT